MVLSREERKRGIRIVKQYLGCFLCKSTQNLCYHHSNSQSKEFDMAQGHKHLEKQISEEFGKVVVLCLKCHNRVHTKNLIVASELPRKLWLEWRSRKLRTKAVKSKRLLARQLNFLEYNSALYAPGNKTDEQYRERGLFEERLLQLQESGENMTEIARALGMYIKPTSGRSEAMARALKRARKARSEAQSQGT